MTCNIFGRRSAVIAVLLCTTTAAHADVTAQQVWDSWKGQMQVYGDAGISFGAETMAGDTLTVESIMIDMSDEYGDFRVTADMGPITFTEQGDGTVAIAFPESYPMRIAFDDGDEYFDLLITQQNAQMTATGTPEAVSYALSADRYAIEVAGISPEMQEEATFEAGILALNDVTGTYLVSEGNLQTISYALDIGSLEADMLIRENGGRQESVTFKAMVDGMGANADIALPAGMTMADMEDDPGFAQGTSFEGGYAFGASTYSFLADFENDYVAVDAEVAEGALDFAMNLDGLRYSTMTRGVAVTANIPEEFPMPIEASLAEASFVMDAPLSKSDTPRDMQIGFALRELDVADPMWSLFDPGAVLPRDPVTLVIDITGKVTPLFDLLDPEQQMAAAMSDLPGELNELTLNELTVRAVGAELFGNGAFTFDNTDLQTFDGLPRPEGQLTVRVNGANALIDNLITMGLIPQDQAMMPRMMLGMFATPVGDDQLESVIEINDQGHILANGQRLQ